MRTTTTTTVADIPSAATRSIDAKVFWRLIPIILISLVINQLDKVNVAFAKIQMAPEIGLSNAAYGLGAGIFFIGYCLFEVPSNMLLHRIGVRTWITRILVTWGLLSAATMFVTGPMSFYFVRFMLGVAEAGFAPGIMLYVSQWFPSRTRGRAIGIFMTALPLSGLIGSPLSTWLMTSVPAGMPLQGWQWMFLAEGLPAVLCGVVFWLTICDRIDDAHWLTTEEKTLLKAELNEVSHEHGSFRTGLTDARVWLLSLIYFSFVAALYGVGFWLPSLIQALGVHDLRQIGLLTAIPYGAAIVVMLTLSWSSDRLRERRKHLALTGLVGAISLVLSVVLREMPVASFIALVTAMATVIATIPLFWNLPTAFLSGAAAATGFALITSVGNLSGFAAPFLVGLLTDLTGSTMLSICVLAGVAAIGAIATLCVPRRLVERAKS